MDPGSVGGGITFICDQTHTYVNTGGLSRSVRHVLHVRLRVDDAS